MSCHRCSPAISQYPDDKPMSAFTGRMHSLLTTFELQLVLLLPVSVCTFVSISG